MSTSNPSYVLISRNPRSLAHPQLAPTSPPRHSPDNHPYPPPHLFATISHPHPADSDAGPTSLTGGNGGENGNGPGSGNTRRRWRRAPHRRTRSTPSLRNLRVRLGRSGEEPRNESGRGVNRRGDGDGIGGRMSVGEEEEACDKDEYDDEESQVEEEEEVVVHESFTKDAPLPGNVKVIVGKNEFWCHKELLWFASPFFQAIFQGNWAETAIASQPELPSQVIHKPNPNPNSTLTTDTTLTGDNDNDKTNNILPDDNDNDTDTGLHKEQVVKDDEEEGGGDLSEFEISHSQKNSIYLDADDQVEREVDGTPHSSNKNESGGDILDDLSSSTGVASLSILKPKPQVPQNLQTLTSTWSESLDSAIKIPSKANNVQSAQSIRHSIPSSSSTLLQPNKVISPSPYDNNTNNTSSSLPSLLLPQTSVPLPPTITPHSAGPTPGRGCSVSIVRKKTKGVSVHNMARVGTEQRQGSPREGSELVRSGVGENRLVQAVVELHEESPGAFQDFLFWAYPHLECKVTWTNVEELLALSSKLMVPALQKICEHFLMTHASGRPVVALSLAEEHENGDLYREASRYVLDQATWDKEEMASLSDSTKLKLSMRRTWFLERLLKLGSIDVKKEYTCRIDCPDPTRCQLQLDEKWRQAHSAVCRYGPPQPSVAFRCLRQLETFPTNPSLVMPHPLCQSAAKSWVMTLFDRMFQPKMIFGTPGTEKYWLYITLD